MTKLIYPKFGEALWTSAADSMATADLRIALLTNAYTYSASHQYLSDIAGGSRVALAGSALTSVTYASGVLDAADYQFSAVSGSTVQRTVIYIHNASEGAARLVYYTDENAVGGAMSTTPTGGVFTVTIANIATIGG